MVILGGLEFVVGGYLVHRHYKNKSEKKRVLQEEALQRRNHTFPGPSPNTQPYPPKHASPIPQHKYACYGPPPQGQRQYNGPPPQGQQQYNGPPPHGQQQYYGPPIVPQPMPSRRPLPSQAQTSPAFDPSIEPLRRQDSFATLSHMPIANGSRPSDVYTPAPPHAQPSNTPPSQPVQESHPNYPYYNTGFSASYPSFEPVYAAPTHSPVQQPGRQHTVDDNWETYGPASPHVRFNVSDSPQPGEREDDPPPPYRP